MKERHLILTSVELDLLRRLATSEWTEIAVQQGYHVECHAQVRISAGFQVTFSTTWKDGFFDDHPVLSVEAGSAEVSWRKTLQSELVPVPWRVVWNRDLEGVTEFDSIRQLSTPPRSLQLLQSCFDDVQYGSDRIYGRVCIQDGVLFQKD